MRDNSSHITDPVALAARPVVDTDPGLGRRGYVGIPAEPVPVVTAADVSRAQVALLSARIDELETQLEAAQRQRLATIDRYERILDRRTETFRRWVKQEDPRPDEFEWIGRSDRVTADAVPQRIEPSASESPQAVATDGGQARPNEEGSTGLVARAVDRFRALVGRT